MNPSLGDLLLAFSAGALLCAIACFSFYALHTLYRQVRTELRRRRGVIKQRYHVRRGDALKLVETTVEVVEVERLADGLVRVRAVGVRVDPPDPEARAMLESEWFGRTHVTESSRVWWIVPQRAVPAAPPERKP